MSGLKSFNCELVSEDVESMLFCPLCKELMNRPVSTECGHSACQACMEQYQKSAYGNRCPYCRHPITSARLGVNFAASIAVSQIDVSCTNPGCLWKGKHGEMDAHWKSCPKMKMECHNKCGILPYRREEEEQHLASCQYQKMPCEFCNAQVPRFNILTHTANCPERPRPCPLKCGEQAIPRSHVPLHLFKCEERAEKCPINGCNVVYKRKQKYQHDRQFDQSHQERLINELESLKSGVLNKIGIHIRRVISQIRVFEWHVGKVTPRMVACPMFGFDRHQMILRWDQPSCKVSIYKVTGSAPLTVKVRFIFVASGRIIKAYTFPSAVTLFEGSEASLDVCQTVQNRQQDITIRAIFTVYRHE